VFSEYLSKHIQVSLQSDKNNGTLHADQYTFLIIACLFLLRMRNVSDKICGQNRNTLFVFNNFFPKIVPFVIHKNIVERGRLRMTILRRRVACWINVNKPSEYVILIVLWSAAFFPQACCRHLQCDFFDNKNTGIIKMGMKHSQILNTAV